MKSVSAALLPIRENGGKHWMLPQEDQSTHEHQDGMKHVSVKPAMPPSMIRAGGVFPRLGGAGTQ
jgi:hypothetical protein